MPLCNQGAAHYACAASHDEIGRDTLALEVCIAVLRRREEDVGDLIGEETIDLFHIKHHYYESLRFINPTGVVPLGPGLSG